MCRLIAVPPNTKQDQFIELMSELERGNRHGFGVGFVEDKKFVVKKTSLSLTEILKTKKDFLDDVFPNKSWVLGHCRYATRGAICAKNSHPFTGEKMMLVHNGTFKEHELVKFLTRDKKMKYTSDTDSEVALKLLEKIGPHRFLNMTYEAGVFLALERTGKLWAIKSEYRHDLKIASFSKDRVFLISDLPYASRYTHKEAEAGWYLFGPDGKIISHRKKLEDWEKKSKIPSEVSTGNQGYFGRYNKELEDYHENIIGY